MNAQLLPENHWISNELKQCYKQIFIKLPQALIVQSDNTMTKRGTEDMLRGWDLDFWQGEIRYNYRRKNSWAPWVDDANAIPEVHQQVPVIQAEEIHQQPLSTTTCTDVPMDLDDQAN